jgi:hypothetical protein
MKLRNLLIATLGLAAAAGAAGAASAMTPWQAAHPARAEVNHRLTDLNLRIAQEHREGQISAFQARRLHAEVKQVRFQEKRLARSQNGRLDYRQTVRLNREASGVARRLPA